MQGARILHGNEAVALQAEFRHAHEHGEEVVIERRRIEAQELFPDLDRRSEAECSAHIEPRRGDDVGDLSLRYFQGVAAVAKCQRQGRVEPLADDIELRIAVDAFAVSGEPRCAWIVAHDLPTTPLWRPAVAR